MGLGLRPGRRRRKEAVEPSGKFTAVGPLDEGVRLRRVAVEAEVFRSQIRALSAHRRFKFAVWFSSNATDSIRLRIVVLSLWRVPFCKVELPSDGEAVARIREEKEYLIGV